LTCLAVAGVVATAQAGPSPAPSRTDLEELTRKLAALGYVEEVEREGETGRSGVVLHDRTRASQGVNVWCSVGGTDVSFADMDGKVLHRIHLPSRSASTCLAEPYAPGVIAVVTRPYVALIDWGSRVIWMSTRNHHHDLAFDPDGGVWTYLEREGTLEGEGRRLPFTDQALVRLGPGGTVNREIPFLELFRDHIPSWRIDAIARIRRRDGSTTTKAYSLAADLFHPNGIELLDRDLPVAPKGSALVALRELDTIAIIDLAREEVVWSFGAGELERPHLPTVLPNGNVLVFDNGPFRGYSRLVEVDPATKAIVWEWRASPPEAFFSRIRGSVQPLPNGNLLVTESTKGRAFEITREGTTVWEFWNPESRASGGPRRQVYHVRRLAPEEWEAARPASPGAGGRRSSGRSRPEGSAHGGERSHARAQ
jgi:hypothetical protein